MNLGDLTFGEIRWPQSTPTAQRASARAVTPGRQGERWTPGAGGGAGWGVIVERSPVLQDKEGSGDCGLGSEQVVSATKLYTKMWKLANSTFLLQFVLTLQVH